jgi:hypothetical protein
MSIVAGRSALLAPQQNPRSQQGSRFGSQNTTRVAIAVSWCPSGTGLDYAGSAHCSSPMWVRLMGHGPGVFLGRHAPGHPTSSGRFVLLPRPAGRASAVSSSRRDREASPNGDTRLRRRPVLGRISRSAPSPSPGRPPPRGVHGDWRVASRCFFQVSVTSAASAGIATSRSARSTRTSTGLNSGGPVPPLSGVRAPGRRAYCVGFRRRAVLRSALSGALYS